jgi:glycolate oxidase FAD binding subunit
MRADSEAEVVDAVRAAREQIAPIEIVACGTKRNFGRPVEGEILDVSGLRGIVSYEPEELIVTVKPGTPIVELSAALAERGQRLGFEPPEWAPLFGASGTSTIGGAISADAAGSARVRYGGVRDQLLGIRAVNGFGEAFKAGGRVVKNVTGFDIPKLICGAFGTLCALTELTLRVFPKPAHSVTLAVHDVDADTGLKLLRRVWSSPLEPTGLAYIPATLARSGSRALGAGQALFRLEGALVPLKEKETFLRDLLNGHDVGIADDLFPDVGNGSFFAGSDLDVWRVHIPPASAAEVTSESERPWLADWAGSLLWVGTKPGDVKAILSLRSAAARAGGHAILVRADRMSRAREAVFPEETPERAALTRAVKAAFDPLALFNRGRMYEGV